MQLNENDLLLSEFWAATSIPAAETALGQSAGGDATFERLAQFHRTNSQMSIDRAVSRANASNRGTSEFHAVIEDWQHDHSSNIDVSVQSFVNDVGPIAEYVLFTGDRQPLPFLNWALPAIEREHRTLIINRYPLGSQLGGYNHFCVLWHSYLALLHNDALEPEAASSALRLILAVGRALRRQAETFVVHNIFAAGSYALFFLARTMREFREAAEWDKRALRWLDLEFDRSFYRDGGHKERNWGYGAHTIRRLQECYDFAQETGGMGGREAHFAEGLRHAYRFYAATLGPNEIAPGFGDEGLHHMGYVLDKALESGVFPEDTPRALGAENNRSFLAPESGFAFMRGGNRQTFANVTFGEFAGWHSHHDLLSINLWSHGEILLEEVPRFGPYEHALDRVWRQPEAHNQLLVDGYFYDHRSHMAYDIGWYSDDDIDYFSAAHHCYRAVPQDEHRPYVSSDDLTVRRTILLVKSRGYAIVLDSVRPDSAATFERATSQWWHSPQPFSFVADGLAIARQPGTARAGCALAWARPESLRRFEPGIDFLPEETLTTIHKPLHDSWFNLRVRSWNLERDDGCRGFATLLYPFEGEAPELHIRAIEAGGTVPFRAETLEISTPLGVDIIVLNPEFLPDFDFAASSFLLGLTPPVDSTSICATVRLAGSERTQTVSDNQLVKPLPG